VDTLEEMFRYNAWATEQLLEFCSTLPPEKLEATAPGTYGSIIDTLRHLSGAEERYLTVLEEQPRRPEVMEPAKLDLKALTAESASRATRWSRLLAAKPDPSRLMKRKRPDGGEDTIPVRTLLVQAVHHGNDHRTHICTVLGANGIDAPEIDAWAYYREP
jgi:uncharacterized damage-inducible protein DinB